MNHYHPIYPLFPGAHMSVAILTRACIHFSPRAAYCARLTPQVFELLTGSDQRRQLSYGHSLGELWALAVHPSAAIFASGSDDKTICTWDLDTHQRKGFKKLAVGCRSLAFSPDGEVRQLRHHICHLLACFSRGWPNRTRGRGQTWVVWLGCPSASGADCCVCDPMVCLLGCPCFAHRVPIAAFAIMSFVSAGLGGRDDKRHDRGAQ